MTYFQKKNYVLSRTQYFSDTHPCLVSSFIFETLLYRIPDFMGYAKKVFQYCTWNPCFFKNIQGVPKKRSLSISNCMNRAPKEKFLGLKMSYFASFYHFYVRATHFNYFSTILCPARPMKEKKQGFFQPFRPRNLVFFLWEGLKINCIFHWGAVQSIGNP